MATHPSPPSPCHVAWHSLLKVCLCVGMLVVLLPHAANAQKNKPLMDINKLKEMFDENPDKESIKARMRPYVLQIEKALKEAPAYYRKKLDHIESLKEGLETETDSSEKYERLLLLCNEYRDVSYDSMYVYANACYEEALHLSGRDRQTMGMLKMTEACVLGGYFREAGQLLQQIDITGCSEQTHIDYLFTAMRLEFENGFFFPVQVLKQDISLLRMERLYATLKQLLPPDSSLLDQAQMMIAFHSRRYGESIARVYALLSKLPEDSPQYSYSIGDLGYNYMGNGDLVEGMKYMALSAELNIRRGSKEYPAMRKIAETMYVIGDIDHAYQFIQVAMDNAQTYGSKYRGWEISRFYPAINKALYHIKRQQQREMSALLIALSLIVVLLVVSIVIVVKQKLKVNTQREVIAEQNAELQRKSDYIERTNQALLEAHKIKDMMLARLLTGNADTQLQVEKLKKDALRLLKVRDYEGAKRLLEDVEASEARVENRVDDIILAIFPNFIDQFNHLLRAECRVMPKVPHTLTPEMRIFALIRLGICKNDDLAKCLNYSVNTIKSYKTKVINSSSLTNEAFYDKLNQSVFNEAWG